MDNCDAIVYLWSGRGKSPHLRVCQYAPGGLVSGPSASLSGDRVFWHRDTGYILPGAPRPRRYGAELLRKMNKVNLPPAAPVDASIEDQPPEDFDG